MPVNGTPIVFGSLICRLRKVSGQAMKSVCVARSISPCYNLATERPAGLVVASPIFTANARSLWLSLRPKVSGAYRSLKER